MTEKAENELKKNEKDVLLALNRNGRKIYKTQEIEQSVDFTRQTVHNNLNKLIDADLVKKVTRGKYKLTDEGQNTLKEIKDPVAVIEPEVDNKDLEGLENLLPSESHVAAFELAISTIYAKKHLFDDYDKGWPGLILFGPTKTYKTSLAEDILKVVGIDPTEAVKNLETATPGEIGGRRENTEEGYTLNTSYVLDYPAFCFDEFDKARSRIKDKVRIYLQSKANAVAEGEKIDLQMVPLVTLNTKNITDILPDPFIRRSFILDTTDLGIQSDIDLQAQKIKNYIQGQLTHLSHPRNVEFPNDLYQSVRKLYKPFVKDDYWDNQADLQPVEIALKGRMISPLFSGDPQRDLLDNSYRALQLVESRGKTVDRWRKKFAEKAKEFTESEELQEAFEKKGKKAREKEQKIQEQQEMQEQRKEEADEEKVENAVEKYDFDLKKGEITSELEALRDALYPLRDKKANKDCRPARKMLDDLLQDLEKVHSPEELEVFAEAFSEVKERPKFKKAVKIAVLRRSMDDRLKLDVANWTYFLPESVVEKYKRKGREHNKDKKEESSKNQSQVSQNKKVKALAAPARLKPSHNKTESQKSPHEPTTPDIPEKSSPSIPEPKRQGFLVEALNFLTPGVKDYQARKVEYEKKQREAARKERREKVWTGETRKKETWTGEEKRSRHGTPVEDAW